MVSFSLISDHSFNTTMIDPNTSFGPEGTSDCSLSEIFAQGSELEFSRGNEMADSGQKNASDALEKKPQALTTSSRAGERDFINDLYRRINSITLNRSGIAKKTFPDEGNNAPAVQNTNEGETLMIPVALCGETHPPIDAERFSEDPPEPGNKENHSFLHSLEPATEKRRIPMDPVELPAEESNSSINRQVSPAEDRNEEPTPESLTQNNDEAGNDRAPSSSDGSEYIPSENGPSDDDSLSEDESIHPNDTPRTMNNTTVSDYSLNMSFNVPGNSACDNVNQVSELSQGPKGGNKKNFCFYCQTFQSKIARHLSNKHADKNDVKEFIGLPRNSQERREKIAAIRKKGNFIHNVNEEWNQGKIIPVRRPSTTQKRCATFFEACPNCRGLYSKNNLRHHYRICRKSTKAHAKSVLSLARRAVGRIHASASKVLRQKVFPVLRDDEISRLVRYDELLILYGNKLCKLLPLPHQHDEIRAHLRRCGRFLQIVMKKDLNVKNMTDVFDPKHYNVTIDAINTLAGLNPDSQLYQVPSNASAMGTALKKIGLILEAECIKNHDPDKKKNTKDFLKLFSEDFGCSVNKGVAESQTQARQGKTAKLPNTQDIKALDHHLDVIIDRESKQLTENFNLTSWQELAGALLIKLQVFNRKRAGELQRLTIEQVNNRTSIKEDDDLYQRLSSRDKISAQNYSRIVIRGKKNRSVPVLMSAVVYDAIQLVLRYRKKAKVPSANPFVFGVVSRDATRFQFLKACDLMRKFSVNCNAKNASSLRGTNLRKQLATQCATYDLTDKQISQVAGFMGHDEKIHRDHYRQPQAAVDILDMSKVLEKAQGQESSHGINDTNSTIQTDRSSTDASDRDTAATSDGNPVETTAGDNDTSVEDSFREDSNFRITRKRKRSESVGEQQPMNLRKKKTSGRSRSNKKSQIPERKSSVVMANNSKMNKFAKGGSKPGSGMASGKTTRRRWTDEEKEQAFECFTSYIERAKLPSLPEIVKIQTDLNYLREREPAVIKTWVHNQIKSGKRGTLMLKNKTVDNTESDHIQYIFYDHIQNGTIPTIKECEQVKKHDKKIKNLTAKKIREMIAGINQS